MKRFFLNSLCLYYLLGASPVLASVSAGVYHCSHLFILIVTPLSVVTLLLPWFRRRCHGSPRAEARGSFWWYGRSEDQQRWGCKHSLFNAAQEGIKYENKLDPGRMHRSWKVDMVSHASWYNSLYYLGQRSDEWISAISVHPLWYSDAIATSHSRTTGELFR